MLRRVGATIKDALRAMVHTDTPRDAGAISYFVLFTLFPSVLVIVAVVDEMLGWIDLHGWVINQIGAVFPGSAPSLAGLSNPSPPVLISCLLLLSWTSTWAFTFVENALNRAWGVRKQRSFWQSRARSVSLMVLGGLMLLISTSVTAAVSSARLRAGLRIGAAANVHVFSWLWSVVLVGFGSMVAVVVFALIYKLLPDRKVRWSEAFSGALAAALFWEIGSYIFGMLLPFLDYQKIYGRAGAAVVLLTWIYTSNMILLFGANFSVHWHQPRSVRRGERTGELRPAEVAARDSKIRSFRPRSDRRL
ncbi:MAG: YihY/virulence factor BrkB family protein [Acidobacteria bacterium]|nr:YihY/virulence factor BrkB family protein [Acidobacteriota bacterium]